MSKSAQHAQRIINTLKETRNVNNRPGWRRADEWQSGKFWATS
jgi:hypothetical protein